MSIDPDFIERGRAALLGPRVTPAAPRAPGVADESDAFLVWAIENIDRYTHRSIFNLGEFEPHHSQCAWLAWQARAARA